MRLGVAAAVVGDRLVAGDVVVEGERIVEVGVPGPGTGLAVPGFIDVHVHGYRGVDFATTDSGGLETTSMAITATGVTAFRPSLMSLPLDQLLAAMTEHRAASSTGARILPLHLEGPFLSTVHPGAHDPGCLRELDPNLIRELADTGTMGHMTLAPELPGAEGVIRMLVERGITVSLGHSDADAATAHRAYDLGARAVTHVFNACKPLRHRDPGLVGVALTRQDVFVEMILDGVHLSEETMQLVMRAAGARLVAVTDAMAAAGLGDGTYQLGNRVVHVTDGAAHLDDGTIASSVLTMDGAFRRLVALGADPVAASHATSTAPAELVGRADLGTLEPGTPADVVVLDDGYRVGMTMVSGAVRYRA
ncbi:MAG: N-acetylglucosamine-6-phosphate deacetylase [Actinobacteria bacterium]|nr:N-acetylglucosamine-6-phosphate deacetylase [Actinomycetota bacterium]